METALHILKTEAASQQELPVSAAAHQGWRLDPKHFCTRAGWLPQDSVVRGQKLLQSKSGLWLLLWAFLAQWWWLPCDPGPSPLSNQHPAQNISKDMLLPPPHSLPSAVSLGLILQGEPVAIRICHLGKKCLLQSVDTQMDVSTWGTVC